MVPLHVGVAIFVTFPVVTPLSRGSVLWMMSPSTLSRVAMHIFGAAALVSREYTTAQQFPLKFDSSTHSTSWHCRIKTGLNVSPSSWE